MFWTINTNKYTKINKNTKIWKNAKNHENWQKYEKVQLLMLPHDPNDHYEQPFEAISKTDTKIYFC